MKRITGTGSLPISVIAWTLPKFNCLVRPTCRCPLTALDLSTQGTTAYHHRILQESGFCSITHVLQCQLSWCLILILILISVRTDMCLYSLTVEQLII